MRQTKKSFTELMRMPAEEVELMKELELGRQKFVINRLEHLRGSCKQAEAMTAGLLGLLLEVETLL